MIETKYISKKIDNQILVTFMILHEIGHWQHFVESGLSGIEYWQKFGLEEDDLLKCYYMTLYCNRDKAAQIHEKFACQYRNLPMEAIADQYALSELEKYFM